ncbi:hypothetical protein [uncultured Enterovirga sp.]|uniref:hypothetical protein n=1 Tax=uncultured Enterovirga sp. TaxID=2026352 RepID=UPI0035C9B21A
MALTTNPPHDLVHDRIVARSDDHFVDVDTADDAGRSNFAAFLLGGVVIAGGMLAFLYYDTDNLGRGQDITTGSIGRIEMQGAPLAPNLLVPAQSPKAANPR